MALVRPSSTLKRSLAQSVKRDLNSAHFQRDDDDNKQNRRKDAAAEQETPER